MALHRSTSDLSRWQFLTIAQLLDQLDTLCILLSNIHHATKNIHTEHFHSKPRRDCSYIKHLVLYPGYPRN